MSGWMFPLVGAELSAADESAGHASADAVAQNHHDHGDGPGAFDGVDSTEWIPGRGVRGWEVFADEEGIALPVTNGAHKNLAENPAADHGEARWSGVAFRGWETCYLRLCSAQNSLIRLTLRVGFSPQLSHSWNLRPRWRRPCWGVARPGPDFAS